MALLPLVQPPTAEAAAMTKLINAGRAVGAVDPPVTQYVLPAHVDPNDYLPLQGGGYSSNMADSFDPGDHPMNFIGYTDQDRLVHITHEFFFEGVLVNGGAGSVGDGVTPFPIPPSADYGSNNVNYLTTYSGNWEAHIHLTYESGRTETIVDPYTVTGAVGFTEEELYIGGMPTPQYADDWNAIADQYAAWGLTQKESAARAFADAAGDPPPADPNTLTLNSLPADAPQELKDVAQVVESGQTAFDSLMDSSTAIYNAQGLIPAVLNELNGYGQIVHSWSNLKGASNANLRRVAAANESRLLQLMDLSRMAHNLKSATILDSADAKWESYQVYSQQMRTKSANGLISFGEWLA